MAGKITCVVSGKQRSATPEEIVRQSCAKALIQYLGYQSADLEIQFPIKAGSTTRWIDIAVFPRGAPHAQDRIYGVIECKKQKINATERTEALNQMKSYAAACDNAHFAMLIATTDGSDRQVFEIVRQPGVGYQYIPIADFPPANAPLRDRFTVNAPGGPSMPAAPTAWQVAPIAVTPPPKWPLVLVGAIAIPVVIVVVQEVISNFGHIARHEIAAPPAPMQTTAPQTNSGGCVVASNGSFHLRPTETMASRGTEYSNQTRMRVLRMGNLVRGTNRIYQVQIESTGEVGFVFLGPEELGQCSQ